MRSGAPARRKPGALRGDVVRSPRQRGPPGGNPWRRPTACGSARGGGGRPGLASSFTQRRLPWGGHRRPAAMGQSVPEGRWRGGGASEALVIAAPQELPRLKVNRVNAWFARNVFAAQGGREASGAAVCFLSCAQCQVVSAPGIYEARIAVPVGRCKARSIFLLLPSPSTPPKGLWAAATPKSCPVKSVPLKASESLKGPPEERVLLLCKAGSGLCPIIICFLHVEGRRALHLVKCMVQALWCS